MKNTLAIILAGGRVQWGYLLNITRSRLWSISGLASHGILLDEQDVRKFCRQEPVRKITTGIKAPLMQYAKISA